MNQASGKQTIQNRCGERGQTIILVAVALVSLLAMAALAIDVTTLYVARGEMQRAADAAALAGAKAFVDSGITSDPGHATRQAMAQTMATTLINSILAQNKVSGAAPVLVSATPDFTRPGNPQIVVTLQRTDLPTFFARIWGTQLATVTATAVAEAYNAANSQTSTGNYIPITPKCIKPLLVANQDPQTTLKFIDPVSGMPQATGVVGELVTLYPACTGTGGVGTCTTLNPNPPQANSPVTNPAFNYLNYVAAQVTANANNLCPACEGATDFEHSIECCDFNTYSCGAAAVNILTDTTIRHGQLRNETNNGVQCLIGPAPDTLDPASLPGFTAGTEPPRITAGSGPHSGVLVTTSNSIVNFPIIDTRNPLPTTPGTSQVTVIGFLQVFVDNSATVNSPPSPGPAGFHTEITAHILNVVGCGNSPGGRPPVSGGGYSPIPVRLIHQ
jgi:Flp pilus assembly protein TadG